MDLVTEVEIPSSDFSISHKDDLFLIGSCFSENIGSLLSKHKLSTRVNPFGILFNPHSIITALNQSIECKTYTEEDLTFHNSIYHSLNHHSRYSSLSCGETLNKINQDIRLAYNQLRKAQVLVVTFGSAWVYRHKASDQIVANCHKIPNAEFSKELLDSKQLEEHFSILILELQKFNPELKIIFTLSPVRHWKDGVVENQRSKSILHILIQNLVEQNEYCSYFPAYEIMMDQLRDYRFYERDLLHPNQMAIDIIWEKFSSCYFSEKTQILNGSIQKLITGIYHKSIINEHPENQGRLQKLHKELVDFNKTNDIDMGAELKILEKILKS